MLLNVFSKPLGIPEVFQWVLIIGVFIPLGLTFYFIKKQKQEKLAQPVLTEPANDQRKSAKMRLVYMMVLGSAFSLSSPFWMPLTGTTLGIRRDFICGVITAVVICTIFGFRLRRL